MVDERKSGRGAAGGDSGGKPIKLSAKPDLDYHYRDLFNLYIGQEEVIIELGNRHRALPDQGMILDRIVLSPTSAARLQQALAEGLRSREAARQGQTPPSGPTRK